MANISGAGLQRAERLYGSSVMVDRLRDGVSARDLAAAKSILAAATAANQKRNNAGTQELLALATQFHGEIARLIQTQTPEQTARETQKDAAAERGWTPQARASLKGTVQANMRNVIQSKNAQERQAAGNSSTPTGPSLMNQVGQALGAAAAVAGAAKLEQETGVPVLNSRVGFGDLNAAIEDARLRRQAQLYDRTRAVYDSRIDRSFDGIVQGRDLARERRLRELERRLR